MLNCFFFFKKNFFFFKNFSFFLFIFKAIPFICVNQFSVFFLEKTALEFLFKGFFYKKTNSFFLNKNSKLCLLIVMATVVLVNVKFFYKNLPHLHYFHLFFYITTFLPKQKDNVGLCCCKYLIFFTILNILVLLKHTFFFYNNTFMCICNRPFYDSSF